MNITKNTVFITGGGTGLGAGLAGAFHALGNTVIIGGRRADALQAMCKKFPGMAYQVIDVADPYSVQEAVAELKAGFPKLNCLINNAGIMRRVDFNQIGQSLASLDEEIDINLKGVVFMSAAMLPLIRNNENPTIINISSGLAYVPQAATPIYSATKSAVHALTLSLRHQLAAAKVNVIEIAPPLVDTGLDKGPPGKGPKPMEIADFVERTMKALASDRKELPIGMAKMLRAGARIAPSGFFSMVNG